MPDKLDKALGIEEETETVEKPVSGLLNTSGMGKWLVVGLVVIVVLIGLLIWKRGAANKLVTYSDGDVRQLAVTYEKMGKELKSGEVKGKITGKNWSGRTLTFCDVAEGDVIKEKGKFYVTCLKKDIKQISVLDDNTFLVRLTPGMYFVNSQLQDKEISDDLPARVSVKASEIGSVEIVIK